MPWDTDYTQIYNTGANINGAAGLANAAPHITNGIMSLPEKFKQFAAFDPTTASWLMGGFVGLFAMMAMTTFVKNNAFLNKGMIGAAISPMLKIAIPLLAAFTMADYTATGFNDFGGSAKRTARGMDAMMKAVVDTVASPSPK